MGFPTWAAIRLFLGSKKFLIPAAVVALLLAVGGGTYFYLNHQTKQVVATAVENVNKDATIKSYEAKDEIGNRVIVIDRKYDALREQTVKDYANVRNTIQDAPASERDAQAPRILIDTLNELDRLRSEREDPSGVPDADVPVG